jgi:RNA polymerase sigma factor (TIGR02999 family)
MMESQTRLEITGLLHAWSNGQPGALDAITTLLYHELRSLARHHLAGERSGHSLNTTVLVHEAWLRLVSMDGVQCHHRAQFFALCAQLMRRILVDHARMRLCARRGRGAQRVSLNEALLVSEERSPSVVALDDALNALSALDPRKGRVVELRFFGGLSINETAEVLKISSESVKRDWRLSKLWLTRELKRRGTDGR